MGATRLLAAAAVVIGLGGPAAADEAADALCGVLAGLGDRGGRSFEEVQKAFNDALVDAFIETPQELGRMVSQADGIAADACPDDLSHALEVLETPTLSAAMY
jgi:hypothetical protein